VVQKNMVWVGDDLSCREAIRSTPLRDASKDPQVKNQFRLKQSATHTHVKTLLVFSGAFLHCRCPHRWSLTQRSWVGLRCWVRGCELGATMGNENLRCVIGCVNRGTLGAEWENDGCRMGETIECVIGRRNHLTLI